MEASQAGLQATVFEREHRSFLLETQKVQVAQLGFLPEWKLPPASQLPLLVGDVLDSSGR